MEQVSMCKFASATSPKVRSNMTVRTSADGGTTWEGMEMVVWEGPAGYADMVSFNGGNLGVLFEGGTDTFADFIGFSVVKHASLVPATA